MREIKFRAYEKKTKTMRFIASIDFILEKIEIWVNLKSVLLGFSEVELMQYTGLKDKNGIEVYDGDICKDSVGYNFLITWSEEDHCWGYVYRLGDCRVYPISQYRKNNGIPLALEVIGNKFDNFELLEG